MHSKKAELDQEVTKTRSLQIELDETAEQFKRFHEERSTLLSQWEETLEKLRVLNVQIENAKTAFEQRKDDASKHTLAIERRKKDFESAGSQIKEYERHHGNSESLISQRQGEYETLTKELMVIREAVEVQKGNWTKQKVTREHTVKKLQRCIGRQKLIMRNAGSGSSAYIRLKTHCSTKG
jgi:chromosome segregation ATPase